MWKVKETTGTGSCPQYLVFCNCPVTTVELTIPAGYNLAGVGNLAPLVGLDFVFDAGWYCCGCFFGSGSSTATESSEILAKFPGDWFVYLSFGSRASSSEVCCTVNVGTCSRPPVRTAYSAASSHMGMLLQCMTLGEQSRSVQLPKGSCRSWASVSGKGPVRILCEPYH